MHTHTYRLPRVALQSLERAARGVAGSNLRPSSTRNATCGGQLSAGEKCGSCSQLSTRVRADHSSEEAGPGSGGSSLTTSTLPRKGPTSLKSPEKRAPPITASAARSEASAWGELRARRIEKSDLVRLVSSTDPVAPRLLTGARHGAAGSVDVLRSWCRRSALVVVVGRNSHLPTSELQHPKGGG